MFPPGDNAAGLGILVEMSQMKSMKIFVCPSTETAKETGATLTDDHLDYVYRGGLSKNECGGETGLAADRITTPNHKGFGNVLYGTGNVRGILDKAWWTRQSFHNTGGWPADPH